MLRTTISAVLLFTASVYAQSLRVVGSGDASRMPGACAFPTDVYACTASTCLSPLYTCGSNGQSWTPVVMADSSGNIHTGGACPANAPAGSVCSNGAVLGSPTGPAGGDLSGTLPSPTVAQVNGAAVPASAVVAGTNASRQIVAATAANVVSLFSTCSGTQYLGADGACHNGGSGSPGGSPGQLEYDADGSLGGLPGSTASPASGSTSAYLGLPGLVMSVTNPNVTGNPNGADLINLQSTTTSVSTNPNYSDENLADMQLNIANGQALYGGGTNAKKTFNALGLTTTGGGSGQKFVLNQTETVYGMSDNIVQGATLTYAGGPIAGDEGSYMARWVQQQQSSLTLTTLSSSAVRTSCNTTLSGAVTASSTAQTVNVASSTGCNVGDWVVIGRSAPTNNPNEIAVKLTGVGSNTLTGVFNANYSSGATVTPAAVITVASNSQFGQNRVLVDLSQASYSTGTVSSISGGGFTGNSTVWANGMVGGDALNAGCIYLAADTYSGSPFNGSGANGPLHSWYQISSVASNTSLGIYSTSVAGDAAYHGYGPGSGSYQISPCAQVLYYSGNTVVLDTNTFTWSNGDSVELAITPYSDTQSLWIQRAEWSPGGAHRATVNILNNGAVTQAAGISVSGQGQPTGVQAFTTGVAVSQAATSFSAGSPTTAALAIGTTNSTAPITWAGADGYGYIGPSSTGNYLAISPTNSEQSSESLYLGTTAQLTCIISGCSSLGLAKYNGELILTGNNSNGVQGGTLRFEDASSSYQGVTMVATKNGGSPTPALTTGGVYTLVDVNSTTTAPLKYTGYSNSLPSDIYLPQATAVSGTNYNSADLALASSWWTGAAAQDGTWHQMAVPGAGSSPTVSWVAQYAANNAAPSTGAELAMSTAGKLSFGSSTTALATLDASGLTANRTLTLADASGTILTSASIVTAAQGGTGVANTATFTLGSVNINYATLGTGIIKNTTTTGAHTLAAYTDVVSLWASGSCSGYLKNDGTCSSTTGSTSFNGLLSGTNSSAAMVVSTGASLAMDYEGIGTTSTDGILMENLTAATSGSTQQYSPRVHWTGQGWKSNSTATNQQVEAFAELEPRSQGAAVESILAFRAILNGSLASGGIGFCNGGSAAVYGGTFITGLDGGNMNCDNNVGFSGFGPVNGVAFFGVYTNASERENFTNSGIGFNSTTGLYWGSSTIGNNAVGSVGISYSSSGVLGVDSTALNNGNGNLKAGSFLPSGPINWNGDVIPQAPALALSTSGTNCTAGTHVVAVTYINQFGETVAGTSSSSVTCVASTDQLNVTAIPLGPTGTSGRNVYVSKAGTTTPLYLGCASSPCIGDNTTTSLIVNLADGSLGATSPGSNTTAGMVMQVGGTSVATSTASGFTFPSGVTVTIGGESANAGTLACYKTNGTLGYATMSGGNITSCN